jgi:tetratricopeptide (TPR) repeat protein
MRHLFSEAKAAQENKDYRGAASKYQEMTKLRPDLAEIWANLGVMHEFAGDYSEADNEFRTALNKNPKLYVPNLFLGLDLLRAHQPGNALRYLKLAQGLNARDEQAALGLARAYQALHDDWNAAECFHRAVEIDLKDVDAWYGLGMTYLSLQGSAVVELAQSNSGSPPARALLAETFVEQGRINDAIAAYNKLIQTRAPIPCLPSVLGFAYLRRGLFAPAQQAFDKELNTAPGCLAAHLGLAQIAIAKDNLAGALDQLAIAWNVDHNFVRVNLQRFWNELDARQLEKVEAWLHQPGGSSQVSALHQLLLTSIESGQLYSYTGVDSSDAVRLSPEELWSRGRYTTCGSQLSQAKTPLPPSRALLLCQCAFYSGDYWSSLSASRTALRLDPQNLMGLYWKAKSAQKLAEAALQQMNSLAPGSTKVHLLLAELGRAKQDFRSAQAEYEQAIASGANDPSAYLGLAQTYVQVSQDDRALEQLKHVLDADPSNPEAALLEGEILVRHYNYAGAILYLKLALNGFPLSTPRIHGLLGRCYAAQGAYSQAVSELKLALPVDAMGNFHYQLYRVYEKLGDRGAAMAALHQSEVLRKAEQQAEEERQREGMAAGPLP